MRWQSLAKVLCCGPAHGGVQAGVQTAVARSGKGAVQGAVQACCEAAAYSAVAKWLWLLFTAVGEPVVPDLEALVRTLACGSKIGTHWFQRLGTSSSDVAAANSHCKKTRF